MFHPNATNRAEGPTPRLAPAQGRSCARTFAAHRLKPYDRPHD